MARPGVSMFLCESLVLSLLCLGARSDDGVPHVVASAEPIRAQVGGQVVLPCHVAPPLSVAAMTVEWSWSKDGSWSRDEAGTRYVFIYRNRREDPDMKAAEYQGRVTLFLEQLQLGNMSLRISNLSLEDSGTYHCHLPKLTSHASVQLIVSTESFKESNTTEDKLDETNVTHASCSRLFLFISIVIPIIVVLVLVALGLKWYCSREDEKKAMMV